MPDNATILTDWLKTRRKQYFCHRCLIAGTGVKPAAQVNQIVRPLANAKEYRYFKTTCSACAADRMCVGYFG
jgi:hypothetical protein